VTLAMATSKLIKPTEIRESKEKHITPLAIASYKATEASNVK